MKAIFDIELTSEGYYCHYEAQVMPRDTNGSINLKAHRKCLLAILHQVSGQLTEDEEAANIFNWTGSEIQKLKDVC
jgi:hypothetical protein